eukprot:GHVQ01012193.1.p5 GENE.GHVQ01012193.1~~GHVQ01012193.1.p5  ORF type:complete len:172 (+),score=30.65 GHVQ01012193.1:385-900(+)
MEKGGNEEEPREQPEQRGRQPPTTEGKGSVVDLDFTTANPLAAIDIDELNPEPIGPLRSADDQSDSIPRPVISETSQPTMVTALSATTEATGSNDRKMDEPLYWQQAQLTKAVQALAERTGQPRVSDREEERREGNPFPPSLGRNCAWEAKHTQKRLSVGNTSTAKPRNAG